MSRIQPIATSLQAQDLFQAMKLCLSLPMPSLPRFRGKQARVMPEKEAVENENLFRAELEVPETEPLGVMLVAHPRVEGVLILSDSGRVLLEFNRRNPHLRIEPGQAILEVNGITDPRKMMDEFQMGQNLDMLVSTELDPLQRRLFKQCLEEQHREEVLNEHMVSDVATGTCPICHEEMDGQDVVKLPCGHHFHCGCIKRWAVHGKGHMQCPMCREEIGVKA